MKITCPQCQFTREIIKEKLPSLPTNATCPQCKHRFTISDEKTNTKVINNQEPSTATLNNNDKQNLISNPIDLEKKQTINKNIDDKITQENINSQSTLTKPVYITEKEFVAAFGIDNPWEKASKLGYFFAFYHTCLRILKYAPRFFTGLVATGPQIPALLFYCIIAIIQMSFERFWGHVLSNLLTPLATGNEQLQMLLSMLSSKSPYLITLVMGTAISIVELFISSALFFLLFRLVAGQRANFNIIFQVVAYSSAPMILCIIPAFGSIIGFIWCIVCTAIGCRYAMRLSWNQVLIGILPAYLIGLILLLQVLFSL